MLSYKDILNLIKESNITLIGYTFECERIKDELISNFNYIEIEEIDSSFSFKSFLRDLKLKSILYNSNSVKYPEYIFLDTNNIRPGRQNKSVVENLKNLYKEYSDQNPQFKIILTSSMYISCINSECRDINNFRIGNQPLYFSDLVLTIFNNKITIIKNRNSI